MITGARYSSYDQNLIWLNPLIELIRNIHDHYPNVKFMGICLGHQILARALGGNTGRNPQQNFIYKLEEVSAHEEFDGLPSKLKVAESHGDCVTEVPSTARVIYSSQTCAVEMLRYGDRAITIQGHPEFTSNLIYHFHSKYCCRRNRQEECFQNILETYARERTDSDKIIEAFNRFLRKV